MASGEEQVPLSRSFLLSVNIDHELEPFARMLDQVLHQMRHTFMNRPETRVGEKFLS